MVVKKRTATSRSRERATGGGGSLTVDFTGVADKGRARYVPGDYGVKVVSAKRTVSGQKQTKQVEVVMTFLDGAHKGKKITHRMNLLPQSLWVLRNFLEAIGIKAKGKARLNFAEWKGQKLGITVDDDTFTDRKSKKKRTSSKITDTYPFSELEARRAMSEDLDEDEDEEDEDIDEEEDEDSIEVDEDEDEEEDEDEDDEEEEDEDEDEDDDDL